MPKINWRRGDRPRDARHRCPLRHWDTPNSNHHLKRLASRHYRRSVRVLLLRGDVLLPRIVRSILYDYW